MTRTLSILLIAALCAAETWAQSTVWTVAADGSGDVLDVQSAVDAAADGDIIQVAAGIQGPFRVDGKGLFIFGLAGAAIFQAAPGPGPAVPTVTIANLGPDQTVVLDGFTIFNSLPGISADLEVLDCAGPVWLQDLFLDSYGAPALRVHASGSVVVSDTLAQTNLMPTSPTGDPQPGAGMIVSGGSRVFTHAAQASGSHGVFFFQGSVPPNAAPDGGAGLQLIDSRAKLNGGDFGGTSGSSLAVNGCTEGGDGGAGVLVQHSPGGGSSSLVLRDTAVSGGSPGFFDALCAPTPQAGLPVDLQAGTLTELVGVARHLSLPGVAPVGGSLPITFEGLAGDAAWLFASTSAVPGLETGLHDIHLDPNALLFLFVTPLIGNTATVTLPVVPLPAGIDGVVAPLQALFVDGSGQQHLSGPRAVLVR